MCWRMCLYDASCAGLRLYKFSFKQGQVGHRVRPANRQKFALPTNQRTQPGVGVGAPKKPKGPNGKNYKNRRKFAEDQHSENRIAHQSRPYILQTYKRSWRHHEKDLIG